MSHQHRTEYPEQKETLLGDYQERLDSNEHDRSLVANADQIVRLQSALRVHRIIVFCTFGFFSIILLAVLGVTLAAGKEEEVPVTRPLNSSANPSEAFTSWIDCGRSAAEARRQGCVFDLMLSTWIHSSCYDGEMMKRYLRQGNHSYFHDEEMQHELSEEEALRGEYRTIWTDGEFHLRHCVYLMDMQLRAYVTGGPIEVSIYNHGQSQHCVNMTLWHDRDGKKTKLHALRGKCGLPKKR